MTSLSNLALPISSTAPQLREAAVLTRVVEKVFRKLVRMLIGRMSLKKLQELIQIIFVEEAETRLKQEAPEKNVTLADLAFLTGVDTRTIKKARKNIVLGNPIHRDGTFLDGFMPMFKVLDLWMHDERFFDVGLGKPKILEIEGEQASFSQLVKLTLQSRGLTTQLVLKRLEEIGVIHIDSLTQTVRLIQEDNIFISKEDLDSLEVGFTAIGNLADTVDHNIRNPLNKDTKYFQRGCWNYQFSPEKIKQIRKLIHNYLTTTDKKSRELITSLAEPKSQNGQLTAGISVFYFEEETRN